MLTRLPAWSGLFAVLSLALLLLSACGEEIGGAGAVDGGVAMGLVERQVAFGPRVPGTEAHAAALEWMTAYLRERADTVEQRPFTWVTTRGDTLALTNVWASFSPESPSRVLLLAHWDSRPVAEMSSDSADRGRPVPGANDGASGVAVLLAVADALAEDPPGIGVDLLLTDGEDWGHDPVTYATEVQDMFLGARRFAATRGGSYRPLFAILLDLVGDRDPHFPMEGNSVRYAPEVVRRVWETAADLGHSDVFVSRQGRAINDDHVPLNEIGIRTIDVIDFDYPYWHTVEDTPDKVSARTLGIVREVVLETIRRHAGGPSGPPPPPGFSPPAGRRGPLGRG
ncbi:MAG: M28 family peptidase [Gemmatimonadetes bacterium]|nr:M28 family peptidase [Gemmatimonadota bacterium]